MRSLNLACLPLAVALAFASAPAAAQLQPEDASLVPLFLETCTRDGVNAEAILAAVTSSPEWTEVPSPTVDVRALGQVPSRLMGGVFRRTDSLRQWHRTVNGRELTLVIATLPARSVYRHLCALFAPNIRNAIPYLEAMRDGMRAVSLSGRSTDLPHYQEYGNRLADRRRAHADIFSRSRALPTPRTMHLAIVFE